MAEKKFQKKTIIKYYYASNSLSQFLWYLKIWDFIKQYSFFGVNYKHFSYKVYVHGSFNFFHDKPVKDLDLTITLVSELDEVSDFCEKKQIESIFVAKLNEWIENYNRSSDFFYYFELYICVIPKQDANFSLYSHGQHVLSFYTNHVLKNSVFRFCQSLWQVFKKMYKKII